MTSPGQCIAVASGKGGTGKTSFTAGVGAALALSGRRVLCLDCDIGLRNLDLALGLSDRTLMDFSDVAQNRCSLELAAVEHPKIPGLFLLTAPARPHGRPVTEIQMADLLREVKDRYDFLFIDCPPSLELLTLNALCAADAILVPVQGEYYALEGLSDLMNTVRIVRRSLNPRLELDGVLLTMFDGRTNLALQVAEEVKHYFPGKVYATVIPRNVRLSEAPSHGKPITAYDRTSRGAEAYTAFAAEFLKKQSA